MTTDSVRSWQAQTPHPQEPAVPAHTHVFCLQQKEMMNGGKGTRPRVRARGDSPVERSTKLPVSSSHQRSTSQRCVANHAFTTCYTTQPTTAAYDHMEREEPRKRFRDMGHLTVELKGRSVASKIAEEGKTTKQKKHYRISGWPLNVWQASSGGSPADLLIASRWDFDSVMMHVKIRIINRNRGGDYREPRAAPLVITPSRGNNYGHHGNHHANLDTCAPWSCVPVSCRKTTFEGLSL